MRREAVRNRVGRVLGSYEDNGISGQIDTRNATGRLLGYCETSRDQTREAGRYLTQGNVPANLIFSGGPL